MELPEFHVKKGEIHGVIGESGSGKSLLLFSIIGLLSPALKMDWEAIWSENGEPVFLNQSDQEKLRLLRGKSMGMVFQEPMTALNPRQKCGAQIAELFSIHKNHFQGEIKTAILNALKSYTRFLRKLPYARGKFSHSPPVYCSVHWPDRRMRRTKSAHIIFLHFLS